MKKLILKFENSRFYEFLDDLDGSRTINFILFSYIVIFIFGISKMNEKTLDSMHNKFDLKIIFGIEFIVIKLISLVILLSGIFLLIVLIRRFRRDNQYETGLVGLLSYIFPMLLSISLINLIFCNQFLYFSFYVFVGFIGTFALFGICFIIISIIMFCK